MYQVGRIIYTQMLNDEAGTEGDITFTRISENEFMFVTGPTSHNKDYYWLLSHSKNLKYRNY